jgi:hypothetical protein
MQILSKLFCITFLITFSNILLMAKSLETKILICANPEKTWAALTDFEHYPNWNPFITAIKGDLQVGTTLTAHIQPPEGQGMTFKPKILVVEKNKEFRWLGHLLFAGLFDGEHCFKLHDNGDGTTTFIQSEQFSGILVPLFKKMIDTNTKRGFEAMNEKLKALVEAQ